VHLPEVLTTYPISLDVLHCPDPLSGVVVSQINPVDAVQSDSGPQKQSLAFAKVPLIILQTGMIVEEHWCRSLKQ
jgi:hypothetical protein